MPRALLVLFVLASPLACKRRPAEEPAAAAPSTGPAAAPAAEEAIDALNPPPPPPPARDLAVKVDTLNGDPNGPRRADIDAAQAEAQKKVQACLDGLPAAAITNGKVALSIRYTLGNDGKATDVAVEGGASPEVSACGKSALEGVAFPRFSGATLTNTINLTYARPAPPR